LKAHREKVGTSYISRYVNAVRNQTKRKKVLKE